MSVPRVIFIGFALVCAVIAFVIVRGMTGATKPQPSAVAAISGPRVLVASREVEAGSLLQPSDLEWRVWAEPAVSPAFIQEKQAPKALEEYSGAVARQTLVAGEPIVSERVVKPGEQGFMAAMLSPGYRAIAVPISEETAAGGFILPNDRVDVILTRKVMIMVIGGAQTEEIRSGVVLQDVRVLAIDQTYRRKKGEEEAEPLTGSVALLELSPRDSELLAMADEMGDLSLALRPVQSIARSTGSASVKTPALDQFAQAARDQIKIHSFGELREVDAQAAGGGQ